MYINILNIPIPFYVYHLYNKFLGFMLTEHITGKNRGEQWSILMSGCSSP